MSKDSAPGADGLNQTKTSTHSLGAGWGGRPIRKKGTHRARARRESWVLLNDALKRLYDDLYQGAYDSPRGANDFFGLVDRARLEADQRAAGLEMAGFSAWLPVPVVYGETKDG